MATGLRIQDLPASNDLVGNELLEISQSGQSKRATANQIADVMARRLELPDASDGIGFIQAGTGAVDRTVENKLREIVSVEDFGAVGDGVTNDTAAFDKLESDVSGSRIDLLGKTYLVTSAPKANTYVNGYFKVGSVTIKASGEFTLHGTKAFSPVNVLRDVQPNRSRLRYDLTRIGTSPNNVIQSIAVDEINGFIYTHHVSTTFAPPDEYAVINRFSLNGNVSQTAIDSSAPTALLGHQGLAVEYLPSGSIKLWTAAPYGAGNGNNAVRFEYAIGAPGAGNAAIQNVETFQLFPSDSSSQASTPCISWCGRYLIAEKNATVGGVDGNIIRVFALKEMATGGPGDYSSRFLSEFFVSVKSGTPLTAGLQGMACDGTYVYIMGESSLTTDSHVMQVFTLAGDFIEEHPNVSVGKSDATTAFYEPESLAFVTNNGSPMMLLQTASGDVGARKCYIYGLGLRQIIRSQPGGVGPGFLSASSDLDIAVPRDEAMSFGDWDESNGYRERMRIDANGRLIYGYTQSLGVAGGGNLAFQIYGAAGAAGTTQGRFDNNANGARYQFLKSRSAVIGSSVILQSGDILGHITFNGDDGAGTTSAFGVIGAEIRAVVSGTPAAAIMPTDLRIYTTNAAGANAARFVVDATGNAKPFADNAYSIGTASLRFSNVFAATGTINTSDARYKTAPADISDAVLDAWGDVQIIGFKWLQSELEKGDNARWHYGLIAQQVRDAFAAHGLDGTKFGLLCHDEWGDEFEPIMASRQVIDDKGIESTEEYDTGEKRLIVAAGDRWGIRPDQCLFLEAAYQRRRADRIESRISAIESRL